MVLEGLKCRFLGRQWMKRSKAWRCTVELPDDDGVTGAVLAAMIEQQVGVEIRGSDVAVELDPVCIMDVPDRGALLAVEFETVHESQNGVGSKLTLLTGKPPKPVTVTIRPSGKVQEEPSRGGDLPKEALRGLHMTFFPSQTFQAYLAWLTGQEIHDQAECKAAFKAHFNVQSCRDLKEWTWVVFLRDYNAWLQRGRNG